MNGSDHPFHRGREALNMASLAIQLGLLGLLYLTVGVVLKIVEKKTK